MTESVDLGTFPPFLWPCTWLGGHSRWPRDQCCVLQAVAAASAFAADPPPTASYCRPSVSVTLRYRGSGVLLASNAGQRAGDGMQSRCMPAIRRLAPWEGRGAAHTACREKDQDNKGGTGGREHGRVKECSARARIKGTLVAAASASAMHALPCVLSAVRDRWRCFWSPCVTTLVTSTCSHQYSYICRTSQINSSSLRSQPDHSCRTYRCCVPYNMSTGTTKCPLLSLPELALQAVVDAVLDAPGGAVKGLRGTCRQLRAEANARTRRVSGAASP